MNRHTTVADPLNHLWIRRLPLPLVNTSAVKTDAQKSCLKTFGAAGPAMARLFSMPANYDAGAMFSAFVQCVGGKQ